MNKQITWNIVTHPSWKCNFVINLNKYSKIFMWTTVLVDNEFCQMKWSIYMGKYCWVIVIQSKINIFLNKKQFKKKNIKKNCFFMFFYYYLQFKGRKLFFNTLECLFMLYTSCKTLHSVCQLNFHWFRDKLLKGIVDFKIQHFYYTM